MTTPPHSMVMTRIGGVDYPLKSVPNCKTCQSPHRVLIEDMLLRGRTPSAIARELEKYEDCGHLGHPDKTRITHHYSQGHLPLPAAAQVALIERRAEEIGESYIDATVELVDAVTVSRMVMQRCWEALQSGDIKPDANMLMASIRNQLDIEDRMAGNADQMAYITAFLELAQEVKDTMPTEMYEGFQQRIARNPVIKGIITKSAADRVIDQH